MGIKSASIARCIGDDGEQRDDGGEPMLSDGGGAPGAQCEPGRPRDHCEQLAAGRPCAGGGAGVHRGWVRVSSAHPGGATGDLPGGERVQQGHPAVYDGGGTQRGGWAECSGIAAGGVEQPATGGDQGGLCASLPERDEYDPSAGGGREASMGG